MLPDLSVDWLMVQLISDELACKPEEIVDFDLQVCDTQPSIIGGALKEFVFSGRLDNLCSSFCSLKVRMDYITCYWNLIKMFIGCHNTKFIHEVFQMEQHGHHSAICLIHLRTTVRYRSVQSFVLMNFLNLFVIMSILGDRNLIFVCAEDACGPFRSRTEY